MSMKKFDLAKKVGLKVAGQMKAAGVPGRFAQGASAVLDKREQRKRDAALGLVPFACKLPAELTRQLQARAAAHADGMNGLIAELLTQALAPAADAGPPTAAADASLDVKKVAPRKPAARTAEPESPAPAPARKKPVSRKP